MLRLTECAFSGSYQRSLPLSDHVGPGLINHDQYDRTFPVALNEGIIHLYLKVIMELLIGDLCGGDRGEYCILAFNLADPVEEGVTMLMSVEYPCLYCGCPMRIQSFLLKPFHAIFKVHALQ